MVLPTTWLCFAAWLVEQVPLMLVWLSFPLRPISKESQGILKQRITVSPGWGNGSHFYLLHSAWLQVWILTGSAREWTTDTQRSWYWADWQCLCWRNHSPPEAQHAYYKQLNREEVLLHKGGRGYHLQINKEVDLANLRGAVSRLQTPTREKAMMGIFAHRPEQSFRRPLSPTAEGVRSFAILMALRLGVLDIAVSVSNNTYSLRISTLKASSALHSIVLAEQTDCARLRAWPLASGQALGRERTSIQS